MKKVLTFLILIFVGLSLAIAQPQKMTYQMVVRDANNELVVNQQVGVLVLILEDSVNGPIVYRETHNATTNANALVTIMIGEGTHPYTNNLEDVQWARHNHFLRIEIDPAGGINYTVFGTQQLVTVPYAFYAASASHVDTAIHANNAQNSINAIYSDTALYATNANHADSASTAATAAFANSANSANYSDTAFYSYKSDTSVYAYNANAANSANIANYADSARIANSAVFANTALSATYADSSRVADFAHNAGNANNANYASNAGAANYADSARIANSAISANSANNALSANYADSSRIANTSISANYATNANHSVYADTALYSNNSVNAINSVNATYADTALFLLNAQNSDTAKFSHHSDTANYAINANYANSAATASSASSANSAITATYSDTALYANNANVANTANTALSANYADTADYNKLLNKPKGINTGDLLYWDKSDTSWHIVPVGNIGQTLTLDTNYVPRWDSVSSGTAYTLPTVVTNNIYSYDYTGSTVNVSGAVTSGGGTPFVVSGFCWSTYTNPTISNSYSMDGLSVSPISHQITGLSLGTTYHVRAYGITNAGISYGADRSFTTWDYPTVTTTPTVSTISSTYAYSGGDVTSDGGTSLYDRGVCWSTSPYPTISNSHTSNGTSTGTFTSYISGLSWGTTYYVRAYATNAIGTSYGSTVSFTTLNTPTVVTTSISSISTSTAVSGGNVTADGSNPVTARGIVWSTYSYPDIYNYTGITSDGTGTGTYTSTLTGLTPGQTYYVRAYATNSIGTNYGAQYSFSALPVPPTVTTNSISSITNMSAISGGNVTSNGGATVTARGVCYNTTGNPTTADYTVPSGSGNGSFNSTLSGLNANTTYYVRAYATNSAGTAYGSEISFTTLNAFVCGTQIVDYDGNTYNTLQLGTQCWMKENLKTTHYADGTSITLGSSSSTSTKYRYYPNNDNNNVGTYGYLYNWPAVMNGAASSSANPSGVQGVCPNGWHVPSDAEWIQLINYVSGQNQYLCSNTSSYIAKALAATSTWNSSSNSCAVGNSPTNNNKTGLSILAAGYYYGSYSGLGSRAYFWTTTAYDSGNAYRRYILYDYADVNGQTWNAYTGKYTAYTIRCLKD